MVDGFSSPPAPRPPAAVGAVGPPLAGVDAVAALYERLTELEHAQARLVAALESPPPPGFALRHAGPSQRPYLGLVSGRVELLFSVEIACPHLPWTKALAVHACEYVARSTTDPPLFGATPAVVAELRNKLDSVDGLEDEAMAVNDLFKALGALALNAAWPHAANLALASPAMPLDFIYNADAYLGDPAAPPASGYLLVSFKVFCSADVTHAQLAGAALQAVQTALGIREIYYATIFTHPSGTDALNVQAALKDRAWAKRLFEGQSMIVNENHPTEWWD